jgi:hypothetical protein
MHPPPCGKDLVAAEAGEQRAAARRLEQRELEEHIRWKENAVAAQDPDRERSQAIHPIADIDHLPIRQPQVSYDVLLPCRFLGTQGVRYAQRDRDRWRQSLARGSLGRGREDAGGIPSSREADHARGSAKRGLHRLPERGEGRQGTIAPIATRSGGPLLAVYPTRGDLERRGTQWAIRRRARIAAPRRGGDRRVGVVSGDCQPPE